MLSRFSRLKCWLALRRERLSAGGPSIDRAIASGFAWRAENIGGVRRHLECVAKYSTFPINIYPSTSTSHKLLTRDERNWYREKLNSPWILRHALFHSHVDPTFIALSAQAAKVGKPWVHTYHTLYFPEDQGGQLLPWQQRINESLLNQARNADVRISVASWLEKHLQVNHGIESTTIPNGVDVAACDQADAEQFVHQFKVKSFVLFVGSDATIKNPQAFVDAARRFGDVDFVMIGSGLTNEQLSKTLKADLPANLVPIGPLPHADVMNAVAACRVLVMTSHREGFPTVLLEAMAMSKPCVAPRSHGCQDVIGCPECGFLYEPDDQDDLRSKIGQAIDLKSIPAARQRVDQFFSWPVVTKRLDEIYAGLLNSSATVQT